MFKITFKKKKSLLNEVILQNILVIFQVSTPDQGAQQHGDGEGQSVRIKSGKYVTSGKVTHTDVLMLAGSYRGHYKQQLHTSH